jgi:membrane protein
MHPARRSCPSQNGNHQLQGGIVMRYEGQHLSIKQVLRNAFNDVMNNHIMTLSAGLSYFFVLSLFPLLILSASLLALLPIPHLFDNLINIMVNVMPPQSKALVMKIVGTVVKPHTGLFTFGLIGTLWTISSGFSSLIEALNVAYDVPETRPLWKTRLLAIGLAFVIGTVMLASVAVMILGPKLGVWIANLIGMDQAFLRAWPYIRWGASIILTVIAVELIYFWGTNVKQRFTDTLPGAIVGVAFWVVTSYGLGVYFSHFANYNKTYGVLGGGLMLLTWLYWSWFMILVGAEINSEMVKVSSGNRLELKEKPPAAVEPQPAWKEHQEPGRAA